MSVSRPNGLVSMGCLHPIAMSDNHGNPISVPCRKCAWCRLHDSDKNSVLSSLEMLTEGTYTLFVTLTYSNENIPKVRFSFDGAATHYTTVDGELTQTLYSPENRISQDRAFLNKLSANYAFRFPQSFTFGEVPVCQVSHVQMFLKRLHSRLYRQFGCYKMFRYVYCSEYGETTFRPHYHLLLFCKSEQVRCYLAENICKAWYYGHSHCVYWSGTSCNYLSRYCLGLSDVATLYNQGLYKSRFRHSAHLGFSTLESLPAINDLRNGNYCQFSCEKNNANLLFNPPYNYLNTLYPKCRDFEYLSHTILFKRYCFTLEYVTKNFRKNDLVRAIIADVQHFQITKNLASCPHLSNYLSAFDVVSTESKLLKFLSHCLTSDRVFNRVRYDVSISFNFVNAAKNFSHSDFNLHFNKLLSYYSQRDKVIKEKEKEDIATLKSLYPLDDECFTYYEFNHVPFSKKMDFRNSKNFKAWIAYNSARLVDSSKIKKQKEQFTLKPYSSISHYV